jgi:L-lactate dehydrogenase complex protein LldF
MSGERHVLDPALPYRLSSRAGAATRDIRLQQFVNRATTLRDRGRADVCHDAFGDRYDEMRDLAASIKQHTLDHLDHYLGLFIERATAAGVRVHTALDAAQARDITLRIAREHGCTRCVKSKSMVTEEVHLLPALEGAGIETIETDLGEFILQIDHDAPSHIVAPMIHKDRTAVGRAFTRELGVAYTEDPGELTMIARRHLREKYRRADLGITGANFLVADTGSLVLCTNEGNADFVVAGPRVHVAMVGIEKLVPSLEHLGPLLKLLARSATSQTLTIYTTLVTGPRRPGAHDGPEHLHLILLDNGRSALLRPESRELLRCIRCGACLNACPVYRKAGGGHAYGAVYSGPIGAVLTPELKGLANYPDLPHASSLCGACFDACPVKIDIPAHLVRLRGELVQHGIERGPMLAGVRLAAKVLHRPRLYRALLRGMRAAGPTDWVHRLPGPLAGWTSARDFPPPARHGFREWWNNRARGTDAH